LETKSTTKKQENLKNGKVRFRLQNIDIRKEKGGSCIWLNAIKTKVALVRGGLNFSRKSTTAANVHLMEILLDNWLKNNHIQAKTNDRQIRRFGDILAPWSRETN